MCPDTLILFVTVVCVLLLTENVYYFLINSFKFIIIAITIIIRSIIIFILY